jgi:hypothetical protein
VIYRTKAEAAVGADGGFTDEEGGACREAKGKGAEREAEKVAM